MKPIPNFPDYFADANRHIYSMKSWGSGGPPAIPRMLKFQKDTRGYHTVCLCRDGKKYTKRVGRLVLETFCGVCPKGMEMCHGIGGKLDDSLKNLSWGTQSKNLGEDKLRDGTSNRGEQNGTAKVNQRQVLKVRSLAGKMLQREIAKELGLARSHVGNIIARKTWSWL